MTLRLGFLASGIIFFFVVRELIQDGIYSTKYGPDGERFKFSVFLVFLQCLINLLWSLLEPRLKTKCVSPSDDQIQEIPNPRARHSVKPPAAPVAPVYPREMWAYLSIPALAQVGASFLGNKSLEFIDLSAKTVTKSMKPIPIMVLGIIFFGKRHHYFRYVGVILVPLSIILFMLDGQKTAGETTMFGYVLSFIALFMDGVVGTTQDHYAQIYNPTPSVLNFCTNIWGTVIAVGSLILSGEIPNLIRFCTTYPEVLFELLFFCIASPIANHFIYLMIHEFGSLQCSIVTTSRKFLTILVNTLWYGRHVSSVQWACVTVLFTALGLDTYGSMIEKAESDKKKTASAKTD